MPAVSSKKRLFQDIGALAKAAYGLDATTVVSALMEREALGPTGVGHGVALPHARLGGVDRIRGIFVVLQTPVEFETVDRQPIDIAFTLLAPDAAGAEHLKALALVSRTLRDRALCQKLRANSDAQTIYTMLTEPSASQAA